MKHESKRKSQEQEQQLSASQTVQGSKEFASAEEMLRHDAQQTIVPPTVAERLARSIQAEPKSNRPWWRRLMK